MVRACQKIPLCLPMLLLMAVVAVAVVLGANVARADDAAGGGEPRGVSAAGGAGGALWVVAGDELLHAEVSETQPRLRVAGEGVAGTRALAARGDRAWVAAGDGSIREVSASRSPSGLGWRYESAQQPGPPTGATVRAMVYQEGGEGGGLWALLRVEEAGALRELLGQDAGAGGGERSGGGSREAARLRAAVALGLPPDSRLPAWVMEAIGGAGTVEGEGEPVAAPKDEEAESAPPDYPLDVLARLEGVRWSAVPLPRDWPHGARAALLAAGDAGASGPTLVTASAPAPAPAGAPDSLRLTVYRPEGEAWSAERYHFHAASPADASIQSRWSAVAVDRQVVLVVPTSVTNGDEIFRLWVLWGDSATPLGTLNPPAHRAGVAVARVADAVTLVALEPRRDDADDMVNLTLRLRGLDLYRVPFPGPAPTAELVLTRETPDRFGVYFQWVLLAAVLAMSGLLLVLFWLRDPRTLRLVLGAGSEVAPLWPRMLAGLIDVSVPVWVVLRVWGLELGQLPLRWPGLPSADSWEAIQPGAVAIGLVVAHTLIGELFFQRSLGKALIGLRVTDLHGRKPRVWQVLVRCGLKAFDLVALPLLLLMALNPYRQRMGDLVARTVVVREIPKVE